MYTPYPEIIVPPGETIDYTIDLINNGASIATAEVFVEGIPETWSHTLRSGGWSARRISVLPKEKKTLNLKVELPYDIDKGNYTFRVNARNHSVLPITIEVSEQGTVKTEFTADQSNMQDATSDFNFRQSWRIRRARNNSTLPLPCAAAVWTWSSNQLQQARRLRLNRDRARIFRGNQTSHNVKAGKYTIPVMASTGSSSAS